MVRTLMKKSHWTAFLTILLKTKDEKTLSTLLDFFLTIEEKNDIADRYAIIKGLIENKETQRELSDSLDVSIAKITRGSNALKTLNPKLKQFLEDQL